MCRVIGNKKVRSKKLMENSAEVNELKKKIVELFSSISTSCLLPIKFHFLDHIKKEIRTFGDISVLVASAYEQCTVHMKRAWQESSMVRAKRMPDTVMFTERRRTDEPHTLST